MRETTKGMNCRRINVDVDGYEPNGSGLVDGFRERTNSLSYISPNHFCAAIKPTKKTVSILGGEVPWRPKLRVVLVAFNCGQSLTCIEADDTQTDTRFPLDEEGKLDLCLTALRHLRRQTQ